MKEVLPKIEWKPGWYADRLHAVGEHGTAKCGFIFPSIYSNGAWFERKMSKPPPHCKKCERIIEKTKPRKP